MVTAVTVTSALSFLGMRHANLLISAVSIIFSFESMLLSFYLYFQALSCRCAATRLSLGRNEVVIRPQRGCRYAATRLSDSSSARDKD